MQTQIQIQTYTAKNTDIHANGREQYNFKASQRGHDSLLSAWLYSYILPQT